MQHLVQLRRMILSRVESRMDYSVGEVTDSIRYEYAGFVGNSNDVAVKLGHIYQADHAHTVKLMTSGQSSRQTVPVLRAIVQSLHGYQLDDTLKERLIQFIHRFPPVAVKLVPLHRAGFEDFTFYIHLHHQFLKNGQVDLSSYIDSAKDEAERLRYLRVFLATFCLGLINPVKSSKTKKDKTGKSSVLERIIKRVRGI